MKRIRGAGWSLVEGSEEGGDVFRFQKDFIQRGAEMDIWICVFRNTSKEVDADGICGGNTEEVAISEEDLRFSIRFC